MTPEAWTHGIAAAALAFVAAWILASTITTKKRK